MKYNEFLKQSNRLKHLIGGFAVGLLSLNWWCAIYATIVAASCLELKDKLYGNKWDWIDWGFTIVGGVIPALIYYFLT